MGISEIGITSKLSDMVFVSNWLWFGHVLHTLYRSAMRIFLLWFDENVVISASTGLWLSIHLPVTCCLQWWTSSWAFTRQMVARQVNWKIYNDKFLLFSFRVASNLVVLFKNFSGVIALLITFSSLYYVAWIWNLLGP